MTEDRRSLHILLPNEDIWVAPTPQANLRSLKLLFESLHANWTEFHWGQRERSLAQKIANLLPRLDILGTWGFDITQLQSNPDRLIELFYASRSPDGRRQPCQILELHSYTPRKHLWDRKPDDEIRPEDIPIPSSGLYEIDLLAGLIQIDGSIAGGRWLLENLDANAIDALVFNYRERQRDPKQRYNEYLKERFEEWQSQNKSVYMKAMFGPGPLTQ